jgi:DUF4097 and DUF4098 domain-containing protein YvlB
VRLSRAQVVLSTGAGSDVRAHGPAVVQKGADGVLVTDKPAGGELRPICIVEVPAASTVEVQIETGGLTVQNFQGNLRARLANGSARVTQSEGRMRIVAAVGSVTLQHVRGGVDILTTNGGVNARQVDGDLQVVSNAGAMEFEQIQGSITARSISGGITARLLKGPVRLTTRTGLVKVSQADGPLKVRTQSGDVLLETSIVDHTTVESFKGNLDVRLGPATDARLDASARQGVIRTKFISLGTGSSRRVLRSIFGAGRARLRLATGLGAVDITGPTPPDKRIAPNAGQKALPKS